MALTPAFSHHSLTWAIFSKMLRLIPNSCWSMMPLLPIQLFLSTRVRNPTEDQNNPSIVSYQLSTIADRP